MVSQLRMYYSRKLTSALPNHTTIEQELSAIVMTLRAFRHMLLGANANIDTYIPQKSDICKFQHQMLLMLEMLYRGICSKVILSTGQIECADSCIFTLTKI